jgi:hypothetical protein
MSEETHEIQCDHCEKARTAKLTATGMTRLPPGWRRWHDEVWCDKCWKAAFRIAAHELPIIGTLDGDKEEFWQAVRVSLGQAARVYTFISNWLYVHDVQRTPDMEKLPAFVASNELYHAARAAEPDLPTGSLNSLLQSCTRTWLRRRFDVLWLRKDRPACNRYGEAPYPIVASKWRFLPCDEDDEVRLGARLNGKRWSIRCSASGHHGRAARFVRDLADGKGLPVEIAIRRKAVGHDKNTHHDKRATGGQSRRYQTFVKFVGWTPHVPRCERKGLLVVRTDPKRLLVGVYGGEPDDVWYYNGDHLPRLLAQRERRIQRLSEDRKFEDRRGGSMRKRWREMYETKCGKLARRIRHVSETVSCRLSGWVERHRIAEVRYDDSEHGFAPDYAWRQLRDLCQRKVEATGATFTYAGKDADENEQGGEE